MTECTHSQHVTEAWGAWAWSFFCQWAAYVTTGTSSSPGRCTASRRAARHVNSSTSPEAACCRHAGAPPPPQHSPSLHTLRQKRLKNLEGSHLSGGKNRIDHSVRAVPGLKEEYLRVTGWAALSEGWVYVVTLSRTPSSMQLFTEPKKKAPCVKLPPNCVPGLDRRRASM